VQGAEGLLSPLNVAQALIPQLRALAAARGGIRGVETLGRAAEGLMGAGQAVSGGERVLSARTPGELAMGAGELAGGAFGGAMGLKGMRPHTPVGETIIRETAGAGRAATRTAYREALEKLGYDPAQLQGLSANQMAEIIRSRGADPRAIPIKRLPEQVDVADVRGEGETTLFGERLQQEAQPDTAADFEAMLRAERGEVAGEAAPAPTAEPLPRDMYHPQFGRVRVDAVKGDRVMVTDAHGRQQLVGRQDLVVPEAPRGYYHERGSELNPDVPPEAAGAARVGEGAPGEPELGVNTINQMGVRVLQQLQERFGGDPTITAGSRQALEDLRDTGLVAEGRPSEGRVAELSRFPGRPARPEITVDPASVYSESTFPRNPTEFVHDYLRTLSHEVAHNVQFQHGAGRLLGEAPGGPRQVETGVGTTPTPSLIEQAGGRYRPGEVLPQMATAFGGEHRLQTISDIVLDRLYQLPATRSLLEASTVPGSVVERAFRWAQRAAVLTRPKSLVLGARGPETAGVQAVRPGGAGELPGGPARPPIREGAPPLDRDFVAEAGLPAGQPGARAGQPPPPGQPPAGGPPAAPPTPPAPRGGNPELSPELQGRLRQLFQLQREGRLVQDQRNTVLRARQAEVLHKYDGLVERGQMPAGEARLRQMQEMEALGAALKERPGTVDITPEDAEVVQRFLRTGEGGQRLGPDVFERMRAANALERAIQGEQLQAAEIKLLHQAFRRPAITGDPTWFEKFREAMMRAGGTLRALMASYDISAPGRQGLIATISHPGLAGRAFKAQMQALFSQTKFHEIERAIFNNPLRALQDAAGLHFSQPGGGMTVARAVARGGAEEFFTPSYAEQIPILGKGVRASERAYITYLNKLRSDLFNKMARGMMKDTPWEQNLQPYRDLAEAVNNMTGRGSGQLAYVSPESFIGRRLGLQETLAPGRQAVEAAMPLLNSGFFAPRFMFSRLAILRDLPLLYSNYSAPVRKMLLRDVGITIGAGTAALAAAAQLGADVELDPRSSDFGKVKIGNTRLDPWGGFQPWARFFAQFGTGERKSLKTGGIQKLEKRKPSDTSRGELAVSLLRQKLSPGVSLAADLAFDKSVSGRPVSLETLLTLREEFPWLPEDVTARITPMVIQDMADVWEDSNLELMALTLPASMLGVGVQTFDPKKKRYPRRAFVP